MNANCHLCSSDGPLLSTDDTTVLFLQLFHAYGQVVALSASLAYGCRILLVTKFDINEFLSFVAKYRVGLLLCVLRRCSCFYVARHQSIHDGVVSCFSVHAYECSMRARVCVCECPIHVSYQFKKKKSSMQFSHEHTLTESWLDRQHFSSWCLRSSLQWSTIRSCPPTTCPACDRPCLPQLR